MNFVYYFQAGEGVYAETRPPQRLRASRASAASPSRSKTERTEQTGRQKTAKACSSSKTLMVLSYPTQTEADLSASFRDTRRSGSYDSQVAGYVVSQSKGAFKLVGKAIEVARTASRHRSRHRVSSGRRHSGRDQDPYRAMHVRRDPGRSTASRPVHSRRRRSCSMEPSPKSSKN